MTLNNFEKKLKEQLRDREIRPSERAWDEISAELEKQDVPTRKSYFWYGIAAGFVGILILSVIYLTSTDPLNSGTIEVVGAPEEKKQTKQIVLPIEENKEVPKLVVEEAPEVLAETRIENPEKTSNHFEQARETIIAETAVKEEQTKVNTVAAENIIDTKLLEVIAQVDLMEKDEDRLTDLEVDSLLRRAQREILQEQLFRQDETVDANALLNQVEDELDQSFRDQIFEKLKTGFIKVRTAVADRNN
ncbi:MAG: hypothetical protein AB3N14_15315 [Flavobacteriaceae bacterium]